MIKFNLNIVVHCALIFLALTLLFLFVISKTETSALQGEITKNVRTNLENALNASGDGAREILAPARPALVALSKIYSQEDPSMTDYNQMLMVTAFMIVIVLAAIAITMVLVTGEYRTFGVVLMHNIFLLLFIGAVEFTMFETVEKKYVPIKPSVITDNMVKDIKKAF